MTDRLPPTNEQRPIEPSAAQVELLRRQSIQVLAAAADALQAASERRKSLLVEIQAAEFQLELVRGHRLAILSDVEQAFTAGLKARAALLNEVAALERRRDALTLTQSVSESSVVMSIEAALAELAPAVEVPAAAPAAPPAPPTHFASWINLEAPRPLPGPGLRKNTGASDTGYAVHRAMSKVATGVLIVMLLGLAVLLTPLTKVFGGLELLSVMSGSMEPTIHVGGVVAIRPVPPTELRVGDAITFVNQNSPDVLVTHRVVSLELRDGQTMLTTKGDANDTVDALSAPASRAVGRVEFSLPYLGYLMVWLSSPLAKIGILGLAVLGLGLASVKRPTPPPADPPPPAEGLSYQEHERQIQALLS